MYEVTAQSGARLAGPYWDIHTAFDAADDIGGSQVRRTIDGAILRCTGVPRGNRTVMAEAERFNRERVGR